MTAPEPATCPNCQGSCTTGDDDTDTCNTCMGSGLRPVCLASHCHAPRERGEYCYAHAYSNYGPAAPPEQLGTPERKELATLAAIAVADLIGKQEQREEGWGMWYDLIISSWPGTTNELPETPKSVVEGEPTRDIEQNRPLLPQAIRHALDAYARDCEAYGQDKPTSLLTTRAVLETRIMRAIRLAENPPVHRELRGA